MAASKGSRSANAGKSSWYHKGVRFQCQGSGNCCVSRGEYGFVFLTLKDRQRLARHLKMSTASFTRKYCDRYYGAWHLKEEVDRPECIFLKGHRCQVYAARPTQCRTWPFWPEVMSAKAWKSEVVAFCPGVGKGPLIPREEIEKRATEQALSEREIQEEALPK